MSIAQTVKENNLHTEKILLLEHVGNDAIGLEERAPIWNIGSKS